MFNIITKIYRLINQNIYDYYIDEENDGYIADNEENISEENISDGEDNIMIDGLELLFINIIK
jgi:hypothetical protein